MKPPETAGRRDTTGPPPPDWAEIAEFEGGALLARGRRAGSARNSHSSHTHADAGRPGAAQRSDMLVYRDTPGSHFCGCRALHRCGCPIKFSHRAPRRRLVDAHAVRLRRDDEHTHYRALGNKHTHKKGCPTTARMGNVPSLKWRSCHDPVTWWLDEVKALRNLIPEKGERPVVLAASEKQLRGVFEEVLMDPRQRRTLSSTRSSRGSRTSGPIPPMDLLELGVNSRKSA